ncbi:E3 ubiquitin-ligase BAH1 [Micractinium conductrix]|uniref:RING-type E3 ubiquitin transferase n=1 Tax=Micractinium conductrix TaxID=554055 RepID=A0A2P6VKL6_9CHLO|nr:E3 ubiquitin-ligase BAH1 [Micractinium conductrix]|eukprot:PSC74618.1 E3 ubiquitin-ligase BAH1 [Micractinium conductrix]
MTKYGHYLAALDRGCPRTFAGKFIRYKLLKKCLKECAARGSPRAPRDAAAATAAAAAHGPPAGADAAAAAAGGADAGTVERSRARFFELLKLELRRANTCFVSTAQSIVACFQRTETRRRLACCFPRLLAAGPGRYAQLTERAYWCRKYARANAVALRKILKKYDKLCGGQRGRAFLQHCWRLPSGGEFLHSPLLDELKAIQDVLHEMRMQHEDVALTEVADLSVRSRKGAAHAAATGGKAAATPAAAAAAAAAAAGAAAGGGGAGLVRPSVSRFSDEDLRCPICLDALYKPVGLTCGHKFCKQCALEHAGMRRAIGTFNNLLSYVSSSVACPQCRQAAVYRGAVRMRQLDRVVRSRFPHEWQERRQEERARERAVVEAAAAAAQPGRAWMHTRDALLGM